MTIIHIITIFGDKFDKKPLSISFVCTGGMIYNELLTNFFIFP